MAALAGWVHIFSMGVLFMARGSLRLSICRDSGGSWRKRDDVKRDGGDYKEGKGVTMNNDMEGILIRRSWGGECSQLGGELEGQNWRWTGVVHYWPGGSQEREVHQLGVAMQQRHLKS
jgi:hypothetical protein